MKKLITLFFVILSLSAFGQLKQKMADQHFARMEYYKCVEMYNELSQKTQRGKGVENLENVRRAAISNFQLFRMKEAVSHYQFLEKKGNLTEQDREFYIQALRFEGKYEEAEQLIQASHQAHPENQYFTNLVGDLSRFNALFADSDFSKVKATEINSIYGDYAPAYYQNGVVYATKSSNTEVLNGRSSWDNSFYTSLLFSEFRADSSLANGKQFSRKILDKGHDGPISFSKDGNQMVVTKNRIEKHKGREVVVLSLYFSSFSNGKWTDLVPFEYNSKEYNVGHGAFSETGDTLYFVSDMEGGIGETDIYRSVLRAGKWTKPENLGAQINTNLKEMFPFVEGNTLYFASNGHYGLGGLDIFEVELSDLNSTPRNMGYPINSSVDDFGLISTSSGTNGFFTSNRKEYKDGIYSFIRAMGDIELNVMILERYEVDVPASNQPFKVINLTTGEVKEYTTDEFGNLKVKLPRNNDFKITSQKEEFDLLEEPNLTTKDLGNESNLNSDLVLLPRMIDVQIRVVAADTKEPLEDAKVQIRNSMIRLDTTITTDLNGIATVKLDRNQFYLVEGSKKGYLNTTKDFETGTSTTRYIDLELDLTKLKEGITFKIENIFYDLNKATLRPESMEELDKLADFLMENDNMKVELSSHTDSRGTAKYNMDLSQKRAQSCVDYLLKRGVPKANLIAKGYGESRLVNHCKDGVNCSEEEHQENRRTEVKILGLGK